MSINENDFDIEEEKLPEDKRILLTKLLTVFDRKTAIDFVSPKPFDTRRSLTIEDLLNVNHDQQEKHFQRLRLMDHYRTTTQPLSRIDLEASYQAFVRGQISQKSNSRDELEQFVRNDFDINEVKYNRNSPVLLQAHLLFHSSKLNEQRANLIKSAASNKTLKQLNENLPLRQYFPENLITQSRSPRQEKQTHDHQQDDFQSRSIHIEHREKKYHVKFLKDCKSSSYSKNNHSTIESLFNKDTSLIPVRSTGQNFPPLSLSALKEYRPTLSATIHPQQHKADFIWKQSIVSQKHK